MRLDRFLADQLGDVSRARIQIWIDEGRVSVDGVVGGRKQRLREGQVVAVRPGSTMVGPELPRPVAIPLKVIYEDADLLVVDKPAGLVVHAGSGTGEETLVNAVLAYLRGHDRDWDGEDTERWLAPSDDPVRPGIVHRLDRETSGLIVVARTARALKGLQEQFAGRETRKVYRAVVAGVPRKRSGVISAPIGRHPTHRTRMAVVADGREARTDWEVMRVDPSGAAWAAVSCRIHTGRTHQIRVHLSSIGHPVLGDSTYGYRSGRNTGRGMEANPPRILLHAAELTFRHPGDGRTVELTAEVPEDMAGYF